MLRIAGVEADDVIGTLAKRGAAAGYDVLVSTGDKDMAQLVGPHITLVNTMSNTRLDRAGVKAKFDVFPEQIVDYLALVGDSSDNIPGVTGVGPKTAAKWLNQYQALDALIAHAAEISGKVGENLRSELPALELSRKLATIDTDLQLDVTPETLLAGAPDLERLRELYTRLELRVLLRSLEASMAASSVPVAAAVSIATSESGAVAGAAATMVTPDGAITAVVGGAAPGLSGIVAPALALTQPRNYQKIVSREALESWLPRLAAAPLISFDTETDSLDHDAGAHRRLVVRSHAG